MATFHLQVEALTSIAIDASSTPTEDEVTQFLRDGVLDVTHRWLSIKPQDGDFFSRETSISDSQGVSVGGAKIIAVMREGGTDGSSDGSPSWRNCRKIPVSLQSRVVDTDSLHFASVYNPVYTINSANAINVYPTPSSNNGFKILYINKDAVNGSGSALAHGHDDILYFPIDKIYLVVLYAGIKSLEAKIASYTVDDEDVELVQGLSASLGVLKQDYDTAFAITAQKQ